MTTVVRTRHGDDGHCCQDVTGPLRGLMWVDIDLERGMLAV
jgi:hypothetical protein